MASLITRNVATTGRAVASQEACSTSSTLVAMRPLRVSGARLAPRRHEQRPLASPVARSIPVSGPGAASPAPLGGAAGQVTSELMESMRAKISEALETDKCTVTDVYGDGRHVSIDVVSAQFAGKSSMQRQRMVFKVRTGRWDGGP
ncbi:hypothetical protein GPECTOR_18g156 [Gonium pectorale]|uniref:BolA protein n=1 Tax=Gonium pectorale TaxID=33097 RepID=A0A150GJN2_GONPE|nr:hypothetical protein GPECTOR_18g156 [Gonium pectorale]|eukprot:KXZ50001.1 hypothetical protein GPECTOR_18g156 [Gonium pectorale]